MDEKMKGKWREYQRWRTDAIRAWRDKNDQEALNPLIRYIVLWAVFNALYNTADLPKNELAQNQEGKPIFQKRRGYLIPKIIVRKEHERIESISERLAEKDDFLDLLKDHRDKILSLSNHRPPVVQQDDFDPTQDIPVTYWGGRQWLDGEFSFDSIKGIASLDRRTYVSEDLISYEYAPLDYPWGKDGEISNKVLFVEQLLFVLYQIRNNIVHGGSAAFGISEKPLVDRALPILEEVVKYLLSENGKDVIIIK